MKVILKADVKKLGAAGSLLDVSDGYARNYLFPQGLADEATPNKIAAWKEQQARNKALRRCRARQLALRLRPARTAGFLGRLQPRKSQNY